jgi:hypothetical protein
MAMLSSQMVFILDISIVDFLWSLVDISICYYTICYSIHGRYCLRLRSGVGHQPYPATNRCNELAGYISPLMAESMTPGCPKRSFHQRRSKCTWRLQWSFEMSTAMVFEGSSMGIPYKAIFWGDIPLHRPYLGLTYGIGTSKFHRFLLHGHWDHRTMITGFQEFQWGCRESVLKSGSSYMSPIFCGVSRAKSHGKLGIGNCLEVIMENWGNIIDHLWWNSTFWASKMKMGPRQKQGESSVVGANHPQTRVLVMLDQHPMQCGTWKLCLKPPMGRHVLQSMHTYTNPTAKQFLQLLVLVAPQTGVDLW